MLFPEFGMPKILECRRFSLPRENEGDASRPRLTKHYELDFDIQGNRRLTIDGEDYYTEPGSLVFRRPGQYCTSSGGYDMYILTLDWVDEGIKHPEHVRNSSTVYSRKKVPADIISLPHVFITEHSTELLAVYKRLSVIYEQPVRQKLTDLQLSRLLHLAYADAASLELQQLEEYTPIDRVLSYINTHYMEELTLEKLASHVHLSRHYLVHLFRSETGRTPIDFILSTRLEQSKRLLSFTSLSVSDIAIACGFESSSYFCRRFKAAFGTTPRSWREKKISQSKTK